MRYHPSMAPPSIATPKLDATGIDQIADWLAEGRSTRWIAQTVGVSQITLMRWLRADMIRSARADEAMLIGAEMFEEQAIEHLAQAYSEIRQEPQIASALVTLARERSQAAWRQASVRDPRRYSDSRKLDVTHTHQLKQAEQLTNAELEQIARQGETLTLDNDTGEVSQD